MNLLTPLPPTFACPALIAAAGDRAQLRFLEFFASNIRNPHTRRAYVRAATEFLDWCAAAGVTSIIDVEPLHVAAWIEGQDPATVRADRQAAPGGDPAFVRLAGDRPDRAGQPRRFGARPIACREDRQDAGAGCRGSPPPACQHRHRTPAGLRDRALIALMVYSFARIGAALGMKVEDVYTQNRRLWVRLREKGGKRHEMPCHHNLEEYLVAYLDGAAFATIPRGRCSAPLGAAPASSPRPPSPRRTPTR